jgi:hypothetical protein
MHGRDEKFIQSFGRKKRRKDYAEDLGVDVRIILEWMLRK